MKRLRLTLDYDGTTTSCYVHQLDADALVTFAAYFFRLACAKWRREKR